MKTRDFLFAAAALTVLAACSSDDQSTEPMEQRVPVTLQYTTIDANETRASQYLHQGTFAKGENVKVRISNTGAGSWTDYIYTTAEAGGMIGPVPPPYYPAGAQNIDILAFYPYYANTGGVFQVYQDQTSDDGYRQSDLMVASVTNQAKQAEAVNLVFAHKMAKIIVNVTAGTGISSISGVSILNVKRMVSFNHDTGAVGEATGTATSIAMSNYGAAVIPPQTINGDLLSIETDKGTATFSVASKEFAAGQQYTFNITVNLRTIGTTTSISGWNSEGTVLVNPPLELTNAPAAAKAVDLNIIVGEKKILFANMNVGAETETDYGTYFAWGETSGYTVVGASSTVSGTPGKSYFTWDTYAWCQGTSNTLTKYCPTVHQSSYWYNKEGTGIHAADNKTQLELGDDAARANWGGSWRMPTYDELKALVDTKSNTTDYTWTWCDGSSTQYNNTTVKGWKIVYNSTNATIFLPAAGYRDYEAFATYFGQIGRYWSSTVVSDSWYQPIFAFNLSFQSGQAIMNRDYGIRFYGMTVRAVQEN